MTPRSRLIRAIVTAATAGLFCAAHAGHAEREICPINEAGLTGPASQECVDRVFRM